MRCIRLIILRLRRTVVRSRMNDLEVQITFGEISAKVYEKRFKNLSTKLNTINSKIGKII